MLSWPADSYLQLFALVVSTSNFVWLCNSTRLFPSIFSKHPKYSTANQERRNYCEMQILQIHQKSTAFGFARWRILTNYSPNYSVSDRAVQILELLQALSLARWLIHDRHCPYSDPIQQSPARRSNENGGQYERELPEHGATESTALDPRCLDLDTLHSVVRDQFGSRGNVADRCYRLRIESFC